MRIVAALCCVEMMSVLCVRGPPRAEQKEVKHVARVGESLKIKCPIQGCPQPIISWEKDQDDISYAWSRYRTTRSIQVCLPKTPTATQSVPLPSSCSSPFGWVQVLILGLAIIILGISLAYLLRNKLSNQET